MTINGVLSLNAEPAGSPRALPDPTERADVWTGGRGEVAGRPPTPGVADWKKRKKNN
jgi:hypothetical protein